jgi:5-methylcytosine-specific restriction enzyme subunit McrC
VTTWIELREHETASFAPHELDDAQAEALQRLYGGREAWLEIDPPSPKSGGRWSLRAAGVVGVLPLRGGGGVRISPKVPLHNLFRMLELAYSSDIHYLIGTVPIETLDDLFDRLVMRLAELTNRRVRRGLAKEYQERSDVLPYVRGRLDLRRLLRSPDGSLVDCHFDEHTVDVHDNQVVAWTLLRAARSPSLRPSTRAEVRRTLRAMGPNVTPNPVPAAAVVRRHYDRLRHDYRPMHVLCRLLLDHAGPTHRVGDHEMTPFVVRMPKLFESFVASDLAGRLPQDLTLRTQETIVVDADFRLRFDVDIVIADRTSGRVVMVLDTKYKNHPTPSTDDVSQVVTYAVASRTRLAILIYPTRHRSVEACIGDVRVRRLSFDLEGDLEAAGARLAQQIVAAADLDGAPGSP